MVLEELQKKGSIEQVSDPNLGKLLSKKTAPLSFYVGFDPTASSLHLGNLVSIVLAKALQKAGHKPHILIGGATARVGDPSGKLVEREKIQEEIVEKNTADICTFLTSIFPQTTDENSAVILNNYDWLSGMTVIEFLRDTGRYFRLGKMLSRESVKRRVQSEEGMSFCEFTYPVLQGFDFFHLFLQYGVTLQIGGSDQWGNMVSGIELIRRKTGKEAYAMTSPLLTKSNGEKLGKTVSGALWLSEERTSPYAFYQYLVNVADADVITLLKRLTLLPSEEIDALEKSMQSSSYQPNTAQNILAQEVTLFVHGEKGLKKAEEVTHAAKPGAKATLNKETLEAIAKDLPSVELSSVVSEKFSDIAVQSGLVASKSAAVRLVKNGGAYLNNERVQDPFYVLEAKDVISGTFVLLSSGKKNRLLIRLKSS